MTSYAKIKAILNEPLGGKMICIPAGYKATDTEVQQKYTGRHWVLILKNSDHVMVQAYSTDEGEGMQGGDIIQDGNVLTIDFDHEVTGYPVLVLPKKVAFFTNQSTWTLTHNLNRWVCAQVFVDDEGEVSSEIRNVDNNTVRVEFNQPVSGRLLVA